MGKCKDCHNKVHAERATDRILRLLVVKVPFEEATEPSELQPRYDFSSQYHKVSSNYM